MKDDSIFSRILKPFASRKVRVALVTIVAALAMEFGIDVSEEVVLTIVSIGVALILGIAHEDAGLKSAGSSDRSPSARRTGRSIK